MKVQVKMNMVQLQASLIPGKGPATIIQNLLQLKFKYNVYPPYSLLYFNNTKILKRQIQMGISKLLYFNQGNTIIYEYTI